MAKYIFFIAVLLFAARSYCQRTCDSNRLSADRVLLTQFWQRFSTAITQQDKAQLSTLCHFPFTCDYCIADSTQDPGPYMKVTRAAFDRWQYRIFFTDSLVQAVSMYTLPRDFFIFRPYYNTATRRCTYSFGYTVREENAQHPGQQRFFDVQFIKGRFKIISTWTVP